MRYAAIDIGTNSCRLFIAEADKKAGFSQLNIDLETTRIGDGVNHSGLLKEEAIQRTILCLSKFRDMLGEYGVKKYRTVATSAVREARNGIDFVQQVFSQTGIEVDIINGVEEASLSYRGVAQGLSLGIPPLVVDLGGGSTEFICPEEDILLSLPLGAVRSTEANMSAHQIAQLLAPIMKEKERLIDRPVVMVGGTATTLVAIKMGIEEYKSDLIHGKRLNRAEIGDLYNLLERMPLNLRRRLPGLQAERADIINKGALIVLMIIEILGKKEIIVSESDLMQGIIWSLIDADK